MARTLRYLKTRLFYTKDTRHLRQSDVTLHSNYSTVIDLTNVSLGFCVAVGCLVITGQVAKYTSGSAVILSVAIATAISLLLTVVYGELRSRVPRVQPTTYDFLLYTSSEITAFTASWVEMTSSVLHASIITRAISANIDAVTGGMIYNFTFAHTGKIDIMNSYLDFLGFLIVLLMMLYIAVGGKTDYNGNTLFYTVTNAAVIALLLFTGVVAAFHLNVHLWTNFFQTGFTGIIRGASLLVPILMTQKSLLNSCDFMWLGIRPSILASIAMTMTISVLCLLGSCGVLTLISESTAWSNDATLSAAFQAIGVSWVTYVASPLIVMTLTPYGLSSLVNGVETLRLISKNGLLHSCLSHTEIEDQAPLVAVLVLGVLTSFVTLVFSMTVSLEILAVITLLESLLICGVVTTLRCKPQDQQQDQQQRQNCDRPETSTLIRNNNNTQASDTDRYGAVPSLRSESASLSVRADQHSSDEDVDIAVEEYRIQSANQCYQGSINVDPNQKTYKHAKIATVCFILFTVCTMLSLCSMIMQRFHNKTPVIIVFVICLLGSLLSFMFLLMQPLDRVLPKTFLLRVPAMPWMSVLAITLVTFLLGFMELREWLIAVVWLILGVSLYITQVMCTQDRRYRELFIQQTSGGTMDALQDSQFYTRTDVSVVHPTALNETENSGPEDFHQMATFTRHKHNQMGNNVSENESRPDSCEDPDDNILLP